MKLTLNGVWRGYRGMFAVALFSVPYGIAFGTAATDVGVAPLEAIAMSVFIFSGVAQFAALEFWREPVPWAMLIFVVTAASARMLVMGAVLAPWVNAVPAGRRFVALAWLSDPNFAKSQPEFRAGERDVGTMLGAGLSLWSLWVLGTAIGALAGNVIGDVSGFGFDVVMVCFFAALVAGEAGKRTPLFPIAAAALVAVVTLPWLPSGWNVIAAALTGGLLTLVRRDA